MAGRRIAIVGGGSVMWTPIILANLAANERLGGSHIVLHDIDPGALALTYRFALAHQRRTASALTFSQTTGQAEALEGADFVIVTISTGGLEAMRPDLEIPERYGIFQTVGDTVGPGGISRALRNIPVFLSLAQAMEERCPHAWLLNVSNPLSALTRVVAKETGIRALGLCHGVVGVAQEYAQFFRVGLDHCAYVNSGLDHCAWFTEFVVDSRPAIDILREKGLDAWLAKSPVEAKADPVFAPLYGLRCGLLLGQQLGALPAIGDRHMVEFFPTFLQGLQNVDRYGLVRTTIADRERYYQSCRSRLLSWLDRPEALSTEAASGREGDDVAAWVVALSGGPAVEDNVNAPNVGQIPELPLGAVVETRGLLDGAGFHPFTRSLPKQLAAVIYPHAVRGELVVEAGVEGDVGKALAALTTDSLVAAVETARPMLQDMMAANRRWLPQFGG